MARAPVSEQSRFGPAQSRARLFSTFTPSQVDGDKALRLSQTSQTLGRAAGYATELAAEKAQEEREAGLRDFAAGLIKDGQRIVDGELQPIESEFYMAGVEMGRGRRRGREVWQKFSEIAANNPRPDDPSDYPEWIEGSLALAQEELGIDPDELTEIEREEYANILEQVRQRDHESQLRHSNERVLEENRAAWSSDVEGLLLDFDPNDPEAQSQLYTSAQNLMSQGRATGLTPEAMRQTILTQFENLARQTGDVSVLQNIPNGVLMDANIRARRDDAVERVEAELRAEQYEGQGAIVRQAYDAMVTRDYGQALQILREADAAGAIQSETFMAWDARIRNAQEAAHREGIEDRNRVARVAAREEALDAAIADGALSSGVSWVDPVSGETQFLTSDAAARYVQDRVFNSYGGRTPEAFAALTELGANTGTTFPAVSSRFERALDIPAVRLESDNGLTQADQAAIETLLSANPNELSHYIDDPDDYATVMTFRSLHSTGDYDPREAMATARRIQNVQANPRANRQYRRMILDRTDDANQTFFPLFARNNLDGDSEISRQWANGVADQAARIEAAIGREAALEYVEAVSKDTMVVNRQPVSGLGLSNRIRGQVGSEFLEALSYDVARELILPELDASYDDSFLNRIFGRAGEFNPLDPDLLSAAAGDVEVRNVPGGMTFQIADVQIYLTNSEIDAAFQQHAIDQSVLSAAGREFDEQQALDNSRNPGLNDQALSFLRSSTEAWIRSRDSFN